MDISMSLDELTSQMMDLHNRGETLTKKHVKKEHPEIMKSALYYFPSWEHALGRAGIH
jgi:hypothetical protein